MLKVGTTVLKDFNLKNIYRPEYSKLHNAGYMHMHDLDFSSLTINSISSDSWVVLKDPTGQVSLVKGRDLNRFFDDSDISSFIDWQTLSQENKFVNVELARRFHKCCKMFVVRSPSAMIRVTDEHIVPVKRNGLLVEICAKDIKVGDELIGGELPHLDGSIDELDLLDFSSSYFCPSIEDDHTLKLTRELGRLSGIFYLYGTVRDNGNVCISPLMRDSLMNEFKETIIKLSSNANLISIDESDDVLLKVDDEYVSYVLRDVLCYKRSLFDYHIPGWYFNTNDEFLKGFIGVISGTVGRVEICLTNREFIEDFRLLLKKFNINGIVEIAKENKTVSADSYTKKKWLLRYYLDWSNKTTEFKPDYVVNSIVQEDYEDYVYDLQTEDHHFWSNGVVIHNCLYIPLSKLLHHGYSTGHGFLRAPSTIRSASALTCIAIQSSQNDFFNY